MLTQQEKQKKQKLKSLAYLMRLDKPVGILLLLWPTMWALWLANKGLPPYNTLFIFIFGVVLMRSAGCILNDIADRHFDGHVKRTHHRPLIVGTITIYEAASVATVLILVAFLCVLSCNTFTRQLSVVGALLACTYPYLKRVTHLPQIGLGVAFAWGVPMAFACSLNSIPNHAWLLFLISVLWPIIYDTQYAMVDREDDRKIGVKSMALLLEQYDVGVIVILQIIFILLLLYLGTLYDLAASYFIAILLVGVLFSYQVVLVKSRNPEKCFRAFLNNQWVGMIIFLGILMSYSK